MDVSMERAAVRQPARTHSQGRALRRNLARGAARQALRMVKRQETEARLRDPNTPRLIRQRVYRSFYAQLFARRPPY